MEVLTIDKTDKGVLPEVLDARQISKILGIGYVKALHLIQYGGVPHIRIGNTYRVSKRLFVEWLEKEDQRSLLQPSDKR